MRNDRHRLIPRRILRVMNSVAVVICAEKKGIQYFLKEYYVIHKCIYDCVVMLATHSRVNICDGIDTYDNTREQRGIVAYI